MRCLQLSLLSLVSVFRPSLPAIRWESRTGPCAAEPLTQKGGMRQVDWPTLTLMHEEAKMFQIRGP